MLHSGTRPAAEQMTATTAVVLIVALLIASVAAMYATRPSLANSGTEVRVEVYALRWFSEMQTSHIDRTQLATEYSAQLTDAAVQGMSRYLKEHDYGVPPTRVDVLRTRTIGKQRFYEVKLIFPRGDAASLLFGFNAEGKITGISLLSMAGD